MRIPWLNAIIILFIGFTAPILQAQTDTQVSTMPLPPIIRVADVPRIQEDLITLKEKFKIDSDKIAETPELRKLAIEVDSVLNTDTVTRVDIKGYASIDGPVSLNVNLAKRRAEAMRQWLKQSTNVDISMIKISSDGEDWNWFRSLVEEDPAMPMKPELLKIINSGKGVMAKQRAMKTLEGGEVWKYLAKHTFPEMRVAEVSLGGYRKRVKIEETPIVITEESVVLIEETVEDGGVENPNPATEKYEEWIHKLYVKTNAPAWLMLWINAAVEYDLAPHWSVALPVYYSGFNYFRSNLKFRTFSVVPEIRWWPRKDNMGFFLNAHVGMNLFNYAKGGDWRYQTYKGHTPALGGGLGLGYRWYFCKNHRWSMEAGVGAGIYRLDYSIFQNIHNGLIVGRKKRTFYGIDQASLSFEYSFGVKSKEVAK